ncbi:helix-turn-helix domain-containing protein [Lysinibacillus parviboronicapiens]|uniref:helix-turn-helix domain-containing protein n=1 Tax=Lysinibacillus parviboronicapiens TaxID=436516 RepID=UPI000D38BDE8|nr:LysR family transcriptional regulator [Lysinibacillus parviboronicapiens]
METEWLRTFIKTENFREVAEKCFVMQSTVTKHIQHLEKALQTQLFDRHGKQVKLNSVGAHFLTHAENINYKVTIKSQNGSCYIQYFSF